MKRAKFAAFVTDIHFGGLDPQGLTLATTGAPLEATPGVFERLTQASIDGERVTITVEVESARAKGGK